MTGLNVVYAVHKFDAENVDEISINVGEQVIVLEKDDGYNDGWWQGRNAKGQVGLFPVTYTSKQPLSSLPPTLETKIDSLENAISKMRLPSTTTTTTTTTNKQNTNSISSKNAQLSVIESLNHPKLKSVSIEEWSSEQVAIWLLEVGFDKEIAGNFTDQEITGDILLELTLDSLKELQVATFGKRFKIHSAINVLREEAKNINNNSSNGDADIILSRKASLISEKNYTPLPELTTKNSNSTSYYHPKPSYPDDDLVSDYSTVIRNSRIQSPTPSTMGYTKAPKALAPRPSIPLDMDLIASSPRLSTLMATKKFKK
ncbi:hypothetical protein K501DRAFT_271626 [Backusella circina FSU 941]|nr:hypothetical protein K501DRAFT_271626 [Backusella circina FSU 941]